MSAGRVGIVQFGRRMQIVAGPQGAPGRVWTQELDIKADVKKGDKSKSDTATVTLKHLSDDARIFLSQEGVQVTVRAGYEGHGSSLPLLLSGSVDEAMHKPTRPGWETKLKIRAGASLWDGAVVSLAIRAEDTAETAIRKMAAQMGLGAIKLPENMPQAPLPSGVKMDRAHVVLGQVCAAAGLDWLVQDDLLIVTQQGQATTGEIFLIDSGQAYSAEQVVKKKGRAKGWKVKVPLNPLLEPKAQVKLDLRAVQGVFTIRSVHHVAEARGSQYASTIEVQE